MLHQTCAGGVHYPPTHAPPTHPSTTRPPFCTHSLQMQPCPTMQYFGHSILCQPAARQRVCNARQVGHETCCTHIATTHGTLPTSSMHADERMQEGRKGRTVPRERGHSPLEPQRSDKEPHPPSIFFSPWGGLRPKSYGSSQALRPRVTRPTRLRARSAVDEAPV